MYNKIAKKTFIILLFFVINCPVKALTKAPIDVTTSSISDLRSYLDKGYITSETLVKIYLERITQYNKDYNAILYINENAINEAVDLDKLLAKGNKLSELHGIPLVVKTNIDVKGLATTAGASALKDNMPNEDAEVIKKLKEAGAIIIGTTNMSEFAFSAGISNSSFGRVRNAYNPTYSPYGSSGGSAVAVALSFATASLGTDTNSSVRVPASAAYLVGMRPTFGTISSEGVIPYDITRDTVGVLTKTVRDNNIILNTINNDDLNDSQITMNNLKEVKIGVISEFLQGKSSSSLKANSETYSEIYDLMINAIKELEDLGAEVVYINKFFTNYYYSLWYGSLSGYTMCDGFNKYIKNTTGTIRSYEELNKANGKITDISGYANACGLSGDFESTNVKREKYYNHVVDVFTDNNLDVIIYPTTKNKLNTLASGSGVKAPSTFVSSATGTPAITIPLGFDSDNLPYGIEFLALKNEEEKLYNITNVFDSNRQLESISSAPSLYEIPDSVKRIIRYYEIQDIWETGLIKSSNEKKIIDIKKEIKDFIVNYNNIENVDKTAGDIISKLERLANMEKYDNEDYRNNEWAIIIYLLIFVAFGLVLKKKKVVKKA